MLHLLIIVIALSAWFLYSKLEDIETGNRKSQSSLNTLAYQATKIDRECAGLGSGLDWEPMYDDLGRRIKKPSAFRKATQQELEYSQKFRDIGLRNMRRS